MDSFRQQTPLMQNHIHTNSDYTQKKLISPKKSLTANKLLLVEARELLD